MSRRTVLVGGLWVPSLTSTNTVVSTLDVEDVLVKVTQHPLVSPTVTFYPVDVGLVDRDLSSSVTLEARLSEPTFSSIARQVSHPGTFS